MENFDSARAFDEPGQAFVKDEANDEKNQVTRDTEFEMTGGFEVEITYDAPTEGERKTVIELYDWLFAEALKSAGRSTTERSCE
jgi:hypothetical protein